MKTIHRKFISLDGLTLEEWVHGEGLARVIERTCAPKLTMFLPLPNGPQTLTVTTRRYELREHDEIHLGVWTATYHEIHAP